MSTNVLLGADPEIFVTDITTGEFVSAHTLKGSHIKGTKEEPEKVDCGAIQIDGTALEFNVNPTDCEEEWVHNIKTVMDTLRSRLPEKLTFSEEVVATFEPTYFKSGIPEESKKIGCEADYETGSRGPRFFRPNRLPIRMAGGHIHVSTEYLHRLVGMDWYVGLGSMTFDKDRVRRRTYGGPGAYRKKPYGFEYRTPSNAWIMTEERQRWAFRMTQKALKASTWDLDTKPISRAIRSGVFDKLLLPEDFEYVRQN